MKAYVVQEPFGLDTLTLVDRVFGFDEALEALRYLEAGSHFGKVCIRL